MKSNYLVHHGVKGMKWGVRRYQPYPSDKSKSSKLSSYLKEDRSLTPEGQKHYDAYRTQQLKKEFDKYQDYEHGWKTLSSFLYEADDYGLTNIDALKQVFENPQKFYKDNKKSIDLGEELYINIVKPHKDKYIDKIKNTTSKSASKQTDKQIDKFIEEYQKYSANPADSRY